MPALILLLFCLISFPLFAMQSTEQRLIAASDNALQIIDTLLQKNPETLSAEDWMILAESYLTLDNKDAAMDAINKALASSDNFIKAYSHLVRARIYGILYRDTSTALTDLEQAEQQLRGLDHYDARSLHSTILQNFAQAYNQLGNLPQAIEYAEQSLTLALTLENPAKELNARLIFGRLALQNNAYSLAYQHLYRALSLAGSLDDQGAIASIHFRLGMAYRKIEEHQLALEHFLQANQRYKQLQQPSSYTYTLIYIAETYLEDSTTTALAQEYLTEAMALAREQNDLLRLGIIQQGFGRLALNNDDLNEARQHYNAALQLFRQQGLRTYQQESALALVDILYRQQQYVAAAELLDSLSDNIEQAAAYLKVRYAEQAARLATEQQQWQQAYFYEKQAGELRYQSQVEQQKARLSLMKNSIEQLSATESLHQVLADNQYQQQLSEQKKYALYWVIAALVCCLMLLILYYSFRHQRRSTVQIMSSRGWQQFCERNRQLQKNQQPLYLIVLGIQHSQQLKQTLGEQRLHTPLQQLLQELPSSVKSSHLNSDLLWLTIQDDKQVISTLYDQLFHQFKLTLQSLFPDSSIFGMQLPITALLGDKWHKAEFTALRETVWLGCHIAAEATGTEQDWQLELHTQQTNPCEWHSDTIRQDLVNTLCLGTIKLYCNQQLLPVDVIEQISVNQ